MELISQFIELKYDRVELATSLTLRAPVQLVNKSPF